jgi:hypothetical protein
MNAIPSPDAAARCLVAAAEHAEAMEAVVELSPGTWFVHFETGGECLVEWAESPNRLVITTGIGQPREEVQAKVHASCLSFNTLWSELGAMRLARDDEDGHLLLINDVQLDDAESAHVLLANTLLRHEGMRLFWTMLVENADAGDGGPSKALDMMALQRA